MPCLGVPKVFFQKLSRTATGDEPEACIGSTTSGIWTIKAEVDEQARCVNVSAAGRRPGLGRQADRSIRRSAGDSAGELRVRQRASISFRGPVQTPAVRPFRTTDG